MSQMHTTWAERLEETERDRLHRSLRIGRVSKQRMADALGIHRNTIGNYLSGRTPMDRRTRIAWALTAGVPVEWLETGAVPDGNGPDGLPRLDSNQQPFGYMSPQVRGLRLVA